MEIDDLVLGSACPIDQSTDAVIPWALAITNTTAGFAYPANEADFGLSFEPADAVPDIEYEVGGSPTCSGQTSTPNAGWDLTGLSPENTIQLGGYFIIPGYFTPSAPSGSPTLVYQTAIFLTVDNSNASTSPTWKAGANMVDSNPNNAVYGVAMPIDASQSTNCQVSPPWCPGSTGSGSTGFSGATG
jgi:hypothetical protein